MASYGVVLRRRGQDLNAVIPRNFGEGPGYSRLTFVSRRTSDLVRWLSECSSEGLSNRGAGARPVRSAEAVKAEDGGGRRGGGGGGRGPGGGGGAGEGVVSWRPRGPQTL